VITEQARHLVPSDRAVWVPAATPHTEVMRRLREHERVLAGVQEDVRLLAARSALAPVAAGTQRQRPSYGQLNESPEPARGSSTGAGSA
jgi:hypothetical protein